MNCPQCKSKSIGCDIDFCECRDCGYRWIGIERRQSIGTWVGVDRRKVVGNLSMEKK